MSIGRHGHKPRIAITMGDPCGVGPEIIVKALTASDITEECEPVVIGEPSALRRALNVMGKAPDMLKTLRVINPQELSPADLAYGRPTEATCRAVVQYIETAVHMALRGEIDAVCTCPIHKANLNRHGFSFPGHTEFLQSLTQAKDVVMMLAGPRLRVSLVTIHNALAQVPELLTAERLQKTIRITGEALVRDLAMEAPRLAVAGLNPHAGEGGLFGNEEADVIRPVIESFHGAPYQVSGPYPPDTLFLRAFNGEFDAVVCMYHDQGLIPIKLVHFEDAVNVTLGLPIIRTSVDHGTAYDLAGTGKAGDGSLRAAVRLASSMAFNRFHRSS
jgi:4-hydroxythreonine-4-phosphate dehydrogenase